MKLLKAIALLLIIMTLVPGCKKYPDGPLLSLHSKAERVAGDWVVDYFSINGNDSTAYLQNHSGYEYYSFQKEKDGRDPFSYRSFSSDSASFYYATGSWAFDDHKNNIGISTEYFHPSTHHFNLGLFNESQSTLWQIQRLTEKEMWLKGTYTDGREYYFKLKIKAG